MVVVFLIAPLTVVVTALVSTRPFGDVWLPLAVVIGAEAVIALVLFLVLFWVRRRRGQWFQLPAALSLDPGTRKRIASDIRHNRPVESYPEIAQDMARRTVGLRRVAYLQGVMTLYFAAIGLLTDQPTFVRVVLLMGAVLDGCAAVLIFSDVWKARRWLRQNASE